MPPFQHLHLWRLHLYSKCWWTLTKLLSFYSCLSNYMLCLCHLLYTHCLNYQQYAENSLIYVYNLFPSPSPFGNWLSNQDEEKYKTKLILFLTKSVLQYFSSCEWYYNPLSNPNQSSEPPHTVPSILLPNHLCRSGKSVFLKVLKSVLSSQSLLVASQIVISSCCPSSAIN